MLHRHLDELWGIAQSGSVGGWGVGVGLAVNAQKGQGGTDQ